MSSSSRRSPEPVLILVTTLRRWAFVAGLLGTNAAVISEVHPQCAPVSLFQLKQLRLGSIFSSLHLVPNNEVPRSVSDKGGWASSPAGLRSQQLPSNATLNPWEMTAVSQGYSRNGQKGLFPAPWSYSMDANSPTLPVWRHRVDGF